MKAAKTWQPLALAAACVFFGLCGEGAAQDDTAVRRATGLNPPTEAELRWMKDNMLEPREIRPNKLGLERINIARAERGLPPTNVQPVPPGEEVIGTVSQESTTTTTGTTDSVGSTGTLSGSGVMSSSGLPRGVDNSALGSFPPIRNQGSIGSCAAFAAVYYAGTHMLGLARPTSEWANTKNNSINTNKLSPKWAYPMVNGGSDSGSWFVPIFELMLRNGAATWQEFPYSGVNTPQSFREWCSDPAVWRTAISRRFLQTGKVTAVNTPSGLDQLKALLNNGYVLLFATDIYGWDFVRISNDPATSADDPFVGQWAARLVRADDSGHAMTIVGYNDHIWVDINKNGIVDPGEKGALKIANSWGTSWQNGGYVWLAYDALRTTSAVPGVSNAGRAAAPYTAFWFHEAYWITARASYTPSLIAQFTITHSARNLLNVRVGRSAPSASTPSVFFQSGAVRRENLAFYQQGQGGAFPLRGGNWSLPQNEITMAVDLTDLAASGPQRYYVALSNANAASPVAISHFSLRNHSGTLLGAPNAQSGSIGLGTLLRHIDYNTSAAGTPAITSASTASALAGSPFFYQISATNNPSGYNATGLPEGLTLNATTGAITGTPTQAGTFTATISAFNASGTGSAGLAISVTPNLTPPPAITSAANVSGTVGLPFSYQISATNMVEANAPLSYGVSGILPQGLNFDGSSGLVSGIAGQPGTFSITVSATNRGGTAQRGVTLVFAHAVSGPVITSPLAVTVGAGQPFYYRILATGAEPLTYEAESLPDGLTLDETTGEISGIIPTAREYTIRISASNGEGTTSRFLVVTVTGDSSFRPANDAFSNRIMLSGTALSTTGSNVNATAELREPAHARSRAAASVWWTWVAPGMGFVELDTLGSDFDTTLGVYTGDSVGALRLVASNDNKLDSAGRVESLQSALRFQAQAGVAYHFAVDGKGGAMGAIRLTLDAPAMPPPPNDDFSSATRLSGLSLRASASNVSATAEPGEPAHAGSPAERSLWWIWTAPADGLATIHTIGSSFDTVLAVYSGTDMEALTPVASDDNSGGNGTSFTTFTATAGSTYRIAVDGRGGSSGTIALFLAMSASGLPNDNFLGASPLTGAIATAAANNFNATAEPGEPPHAGSPAAKSLWWTWTAPTSGTASVNTAGSTFDTVLAVYTGTALSTLSLVAANDDAPGTRTSAVSFQAVEGVAYRIAVDGHGGSSGDILLQVSQGVIVGENDALADARPLLMDGPTLSTPPSANIGYTAEIDEPSHAESPAFASAWWRWTPTADGMVSLSTEGSTFDTVLAVYRGPPAGATMPSLAHVASNDDSGGAATSRVTFVASAGLTYYIAVDGYAGATGTINLSGEFTPENTTLYRTDFEDFPEGIDAIAGRDGWETVNASPGSGATGIFRPFPDLGRSGWIGFNEPDDPSGSTEVWRALNFDPIATGRPRVRIRMEVAVFDSTDGNYDWFRIAINNSLGQRLGIIEFDNTDNSIWASNGEGFTRTRANYLNGRRATLDIIIDMARKRWTARLGSTALFSFAPFNTANVLNDIGDLSFVWVPPPGRLTGNNYMAFDEVTITATNNLPPAIAPLNFPQASLGQPFLFKPSALNSPDAFSARGLPPGLVIDRATGIISGAPRRAGRFNVVLSATNSFGTTSATGQMEVLPALPTLRPEILMRASEGRRVSFNVRATGLSPSALVPQPYGILGTLPPGLSFDPVRGVLSGTPTSFGTWLLTVSAANIRGTTYSTLVIEVAGTRPALNRRVVPGIWAVGVPATFQPELMPGSPTATRWTALGLPEGMSVNEATGEISGTPSQPGRTMFTLTAFRGETPLAVRLRAQVQ